MINKKIFGILVCILFVGASVIPGILGQEEEYFYVNQDIPVDNGGISGDYTETFTSDDIYEAISEKQSGGKPSNRYSYLMHEWTFELTGSFNTIFFFIEAYHTSNSEGDDFVFYYREIGEPFIEILTVTKTVDDDSYQSVELPNTLSGTVTIRVHDYDRTPGNKILDTIFIDHMYIVGESGPDVTPPVISNVNTIVKDNTWTKMEYNTVGGDLGRREFLVMTYDSESDKTILFGGSGNERYNDTWAYDYTTNTWENRSPTIIGGDLVPRGTNGVPGFAYDPDADRSILVGGYNTMVGHFHDETWAYDYNTNTWTNMSPNVIGGTFLGRDATRIAYYESVDRMILFGGVVEDGISYKFTNDTWEYNYNNNTWKKLNPIEIGGVMPEMCGFGMNYDASADRIILFGGYNGSGTGIFYDETWVFDYHNNTWTKRNPSYVGGTLTTRKLIQLVYDSNLERSILFGGKLGTNHVSQDYDFKETWQYDFDEDTWYNVSYSEIGGTLYPREAYGIAYDSAHDKTILACGWYQYAHLIPEEGTCFLNGTWVFNANDISASITWTTDEPADSVVNYGTTPALGSIESNSALVLDHEIILSELLPDTIYYFEVQSTDASNNTATDDNNGNYYSFSTEQDITPPIISNVQSAGITHNSAIITWDTDESSNSRVNYGTTIALGDTELNSAMVTSHLISLSDLLPETTYYYEVESTDRDGNTATDDNNGNYYIFTTDSVPSDVMHVYSIDMWYTQSKNKYTIYSKVKIVDAGDNPVEGAIIDIDLRLPNSVIVSMSDVTNSNGEVTFTYGPTPKSGTYTTTVTDVTKSGWTYNNGDNVETIESLHVT